MSPTRASHAKDLLQAARAALKNLEIDQARARVMQLRRHLVFPAQRPPDIQVGSYILDGTRILLFIDCELENYTAARLHLDEIEDHLFPQAGEPDVIPGVAEHWVAGWKHELAGNLERAYYERRSACSLLRGRIADLSRREVPWRLGEKTEAELLVDCYVDWIRMVRLIRPPLGTMAIPRASFAEAFSGHPIMKMLEHRELSLWYKRRTLSRLGYEAADRGQRRIATDFLREAMVALYLRAGASPDCKLARLEQPLMAAELEFASQGGNYDRAVIAELKEQALTFFKENDFDRRHKFVDANWNFFTKHHA